MVTRVLTLLVLLGACEKRSELYCEKNPEDLAHCPRSDAPEVPPMMCTDNASCTSQAKPFCELASHTCVECLSMSDCTDTAKPNCDPLSFTCRGCSSHADCASNACLPDGICGDDSNVVYVDATDGLDSNDGTSAKPVKTWAKGITLLSSTRKNLRVSGTQDASVVFDGKNVIVLGDATAKIIGSADPALKLKGTGAKIYDLEIACPETPAISGISVEGMSSATLERLYIHGCGKIGINATDKFLSLARSRIESNVDGIVTGKDIDFVIVNNFIVKNGATAASHAGVALGSLAATNRFEFNTVADNSSATVLLHAAGIQCPSSLSDTFELSNNLIAGNIGGDVAGSCTTTSSAVDADSSKLMFVSPTDYHLTGGSPAIDMAVSPTIVVEDIDGQLRPQGAQRDFGADEFKN